MQTDRVVASLNEMPESDFWIIRTEETGSTNSLLRERIGEESLPEFTIVSAGYQTGGRGQAGNAWESERDKNLTFSLLLRPFFIPANRSFPLSQAVALGIAETLETYDSGFRIKWPNDIYWNNRKIAGILIENDLCGKAIATSVVGIGLNVNQARFRSDAPNPVSLLQITGREHDRETLLIRICDRIRTNYLRLPKEPETIAERYTERLYRRDGIHAYEADGRIFSAALIRIEPSGHLVLRETNGTERCFAFKEVSFLL